MAVKTAQELFIHEMSDIYDAEQRIVKILPVLARESDNDQAKSAYQLHEQETQQQIQNLERCFQLLGTSPVKAPCTAVAGLKQEHDSFLSENPPAQVLTMFDLAAASKTEYYEMASYKGLIEKANLMKQQQIAQLLQENLQQEEAMAKRVEQISQQLGQQAVTLASQRRSAS